MDSLTFTVPCTPPSVNHYKTRFRNGHTVVSDEAIAFKDEVAIAANRRYVEGRKFSVEMRVVLAKGQKGDVDNFPKMVLDGLADCGVFQSLKGKPLSDAHVRSMLVIIDEDSRPVKGSTCIIVERLR